MIADIDLALISGGLLLTVVLFYVLLDGFDLGIGILLPLVRDEQQRGAMLATIAPLWDGNETWLVAGGALLFAAFPLAYSVMLPALYMPLGFMLTALILRGVAFVFRERAQGIERRLWDQAFHWGSAVATFAQGLALGALIQGVEVSDGRFSGGTFDWLTPFSLFTGFALVVGYVLLGSAWLIFKAPEALLPFARRATLYAAQLMVVLMVIVAVWLLATDSPAIRNWGWQSGEIVWQRALWLVPMPLLVLAALRLLTLSVRQGQRLRPYLWAVALFVLAYIGLLVGLWPYLVPYAIDYRSAAAPPQTQAFLLVGCLILVPLVIAYLWFLYRVFRDAEVDEPS